MKSALWPVLVRVVSVLETVGVDYEFIESSALFIQGVDVVPEVVEVSVQWDLFPDVHRAFEPFGASSAEGSKEQGWSAFSFEHSGVPVRVICYYNTVIVTDPKRVGMDHEGRRIYARSALAYKNTLPSDDPRLEKIREHLVEEQRNMSEANGKAWSHNPYEAWVSRYGVPNVAAERIKQNPLMRLKGLSQHLGDVAGKKACNLLGSHGSKAVAMALLGAQATVVDISPENARYARELAEAAGVPLHYVVSDVLELPADELSGDYDLVLMENGILHYFVDLEPIARVIAGMLRPGGRLVLQDFHPISTKLITSKGKKHKVTGNYFEMGLVADNVAYSKLLQNEQDTPKVLVRKWTLGEIVTAMAAAGLFIRLLEEEPNTKIDDMGLPKTYTIVAGKL